MISEADIKKLADRLSDSSELTTDLTDFEEYCHDATIDSGQPVAVVWAASDDDVIAVVRFCRKHSIPIVPRGAGTGLSGGCVPPPQGGLVLSTERMKTLRIDPEKRIARVGPGVITKELLDEAAKLGLTYPPDPASFDESTLGGNVAENAGGLRCKRFGVTKDYVLGMRAISIDGEILHTGIYNSNRGFALGDILTGSEGTLAIITEIALRLIEAPETGVTMLAAFDSPENAARTVADITGAGQITTVLEYLDGDAAACSNEYEKQDGLHKVAALLLIELPHNPKATKLVEDCCRINQCSYIRIETDPTRAEQLWKVRRNLSKATQEIASVRVSEDVAVPISRFPELVRFVDEMNRSSSLRINSYGHAGDGNLHVNFLSMTGDEADYRMMDTEIERLLRKAVSLGGTLSGEHGIGLAKRKYIGFEFDNATLDAMKKLKSCFDPNGLLNPGKIF